MYSIKNTVFALLLVFFSGCTGIEKYILIWDSKNKLQWSDFKKIAPAESVFGAAASIDFRTNYELKDYIIDKYFVVCYFNKIESWHTDTTVYGINHERGHFNIGEIIARKFRKVLSEKKVNQINQKEIKALSASFDKELIAMQVQYDEETRNSLNKKKQLIWDEKIKSQLDSLSAFENKKINKRKLREMFKGIND